MKLQMHSLIDPTTLSQLRQLRDTKQMLRQHKEKVDRLRDKEIARRLKQNH